VWRVFAFECLVKMPVVFIDKDCLRFVLHSGQNAGVYFKNAGNYEVAEMRYVEGAVRPGHEGRGRLTVNLALNDFANVTLNKSAVFSETKTLKLNLFSLPESAGYASRPIHTEGTLGQPVQAARQSYGNSIAAKET
jgi:hypothetical protein